MNIWKMFFIEIYVFKILLLSLSSPLLSIEESWSSWKDKTAWFMGLTNNLCSSMYTKGNSIRNVTMFARIDSETGRTIWAKQFNITSISIPFSNVKYPRIDSNDNIYTVLTYRYGQSYESVLVIYN